MVYRVEKIVCGQARRTESSTLKFTEHLARFLLTKTSFFIDVSYTVSHNLMT